MLLVRLSRAVCPKPIAYMARMASTNASSLPSPAEIKSLGVVGAGQMGLGIALVAAQTAKIPVTIIDSSQDSLTKGLKFADSLLSKAVSKSRLTQSEADEARSRLSPSTSLSDLFSSSSSSSETAVDMIIEAVPEIPSLKQSIFSELAKLSPPHTILATNTSSISITKIAAAAAATTPRRKDKDDRTKNPSSAASRVIGAHFMNPVPIQPGVEVITALQTSPATLSTTLHFLSSAMGKTPSHSADTPGFLANRILMPYINEAIICLETGVGSKEDIDAIMKNGTNVPMGPLRLADFIGLDTVKSIMEVLREETGDGKYRASVLLGRMVEAGWLGKKSGKGFYEYDEGKK